MKRFIHILAWNLLLLAAGLVCLELAFGGWIREDPFRKLHVPTHIDREYALKGLYPGPDTILYTRDRYGLRGAYPSPDRIDILTVGGSTTDQAYIADGETWQDDLAKALGDKGYPACVVNAGIDGHSTHGHLKNFEWWFPRIPGFAPRCILYYTGINDIFAETPPYEADRGWRGLVVEKSISYRIYRILRGALLARKYDIGHGRVDFAAQRWTDQPLASPAVYDEVFRDRLAAYSGRVRALIEKTRALGALPVFVTQQTRMFRRDGGRVTGIEDAFEFHGHLFNGVDRYHILEMYNNVVRRVCRETGTLCVDLADDLALTDGDFYDFMHNTPAGTLKIGDFLAEELAKNPDFREQVLR
ncbi:MAG: GDSL-type esterase/lipase family protein [Pseudodesulfovibrio sp.]